MPLTAVPNELTAKQRSFFARVKNLGHTSGDAFSDAIDALLSGSGVSQGRTLVKTANYTALGDADVGYMIFMNKAGSEAVITLPTPAEGHDWTFVQLQAQSMKVASTAGDDIVGKGDLDLDSVAVSGIGQALRVISFSIDDGVTFKHLVIPFTWFAATALAALTDNSGGAVADGTIAVVTAPTAIAATLTDSTGQSGTHDDTLAATTIAALTGTALGDLVATQNTGWGASSEAGFDSISTKFDALVVDVTAIRALNLVFAQNASDSAQKIIELVTAQAANRLAIIAATDAVTELATKLNALIAALGLQTVVD